MLNQVKTIILMAETIINCYRIQDAIEKRSCRFKENLYELSQMVDEITEKIISEDLEYSLSKIETIYLNVLMDTRYAALEYKRRELLGVV